MDWSYQSIRDTYLSQQYWGNISTSMTQTITLYAFRSSFDIISHHVLNISLFADRYDNTILSWVNVMKNSS